MKDSEIVDLYWNRDESAISETDAKYGLFCHGIAMNLLSVREDAEECVNETYYQAWKQMPPQRPDKLKPWLGRIVRNISTKLWHKNHAKKRYHGFTVALNELEDSIPSSQNVERTLEDDELSEAINR